MTKEQIKEEFGEKTSALVSISAIIQTQDPISIKLGAIQSVLDTYTKRILQSQKDDLVEKIEELDFFKRFNDKDYSPQIPREVLKQEIISLIKQDK